MNGFRAIFCLLSLMLTAAQTNAAQENMTTGLTFCYEDKQLLPYYAGDGEQVASPPGVTIEHLQAAVKLTGIQLMLQRKPWLRCLQLLEQNKVDALVATYAESRRSFAVYPLNSNDEPDARLALSQHSTCLVQRHNDNVMQRSGTGIMIARPLGYATPDYPVGVSIVPVQSQQQAFDLVKQGRVDATTTLCEVNTLPAPTGFTEGLEVVYPPLYQTTGYLVFSKGFYQQHQQLAISLWQALQQTQEPKRYYQYLQRQSEPQQADKPH